MTISWVTFPTRLACPLTILKSHNWPGKRFAEEVYISPLSPFKMALGSLTLTRTISQTWSLLDTWPQFVNDWTMHSWTVVAISTIDLKKFSCSSLPADLALQASILVILWQRTTTRWVAALGPLKVEDCNWTCVVLSIPIFFVVRHLPQPQTQRLLLYWRLIHKPTLFGRPEIE